MEKSTATFLPPPLPHSSFGHMCYYMRKLFHLGDFPNIPTYIAEWRVRNGIPQSTTPVPGFRNGTVSCESWGAKPGDNVTLCVAADEGHAWPGDTTLCSVGPFKCTLDMQASAHILQFFANIAVAAEGGGLPDTSKHDEAGAVKTPPHSPHRGSAGKHAHVLVSPAPMSSLPRPLLRTVPCGDGSRYSCPDHNTCCLDHRTPLYLLGPKNG